MENNGSAATDDGWPKPGDHLARRAKMAVFVVISDCLDALNPARHRRFMAAYTRHQQP